MKDIEYEVKLDNFPMIKQGKFKAVQYIDGREADRYIECAYQSPALRKHGVNRYTFKGFLTTRDGVDVLKTFTFDKIDSTSEYCPSVRSSRLCTHQRSSSDDVSAQELPGSRLKEICTIRVEITQSFRKGGKRHDSFARSGLQKDLPTIPTVYDDTKPAVWGLSTGRVLRASAMKDHSHADGREQVWTRKDRCRRHHLPLCS